MAEHTGATHTGLVLVELAGGGHVDTHLHSYESSFFVLDGEPVLAAIGRFYFLDRTVRINGATYHVFLPGSD